MDGTFENLRLRRIATHEVFKREQTDVPIEPRCSNSVTSLDTDGIETLRKRMVDALGNESHSVEMEIVDGSPSGAAWTAFRAFGATDETFVQVSSELADKLAQAQISRRVPGGIVVVIEGTTSRESVPFLSIIKAEVHGGFEKRADDESILIEYVSDLLLTPQQKLYKIGVFVGDAADQLRVYVYDHNMTQAETRQAAKYFFEGFLGCAVAPSAKKLTSDFYSLTHDFIGDLDVGADRKIDLHQALYSYLKVDQATTISTSAFASRYLSLDHRDEYRKHMTEAGFPANAITKDLSYLKNKLRSKTIRFTSGVRLVAPAERYRDTVAIKDSTNDHTTVVIDGHIQKYD